jgi:hypothetical protein
MLPGTQHSRCWRSLKASFRAIADNDHRGEAIMSASPPVNTPLDPGRRLPERHCADRAAQPDREFAGAAALIWHEGAIREIAAVGCRDLERELHSLSHRVDDEASYKSGGSRTAR